MLKDVQDLTTPGVIKGLNTQYNILAIQKDQSPNMMNVKVNYDGSIEKRLGSNTQNAVQIIQPSSAGFSPNSGNTLQNQMISYWTMDEASGVRLDSMGSNNLSDYGSVTYTGGIKNQAAMFNASSSQYLSAPYKSILNGSGGFTVSTWIYLNSTSKTLQRSVIGKFLVSGGGATAGTVLLLHCDGSGTSFPDSSGTSKTVTAVGSAVLSSSQYKFGGASCYLEGTTSYLTVGNSTDGNFATGNFTIDLQYYTLDSSANVGILDIGDGFNANGIFLKHSGSSLLLYIGGSAAFNVAWSHSNNTWYHIAVTRDGSNLRVFIDGVQLGTTVTNNTDIETGVLGWTIGRGVTSAIYFKGYLDEIRVVKGTAVWTSNFTAPSAAYGNAQTAFYEYEVLVDTDNKAILRTSNVGSSWTHEVKANSLGALGTGTWYNLTAFYNTSGYIGIIGNMNQDTASCAQGIINGTGGFYVAGESSQSFYDGRIDETGFWSRTLSAQNISDLYNGGSSNTYGIATLPYPWACFDFGASSLRWLTVAEGSKVFASSDLGVNWVTIASTRTATYQYFDRSKNVLVMTSDAYDVPLAWPGSAGTFATVLNASAPLCKYSINFQGFLILLNSNLRKRSFNYIDENLQLSGSGWLNFDIPSSADDEITNVFILRRFMYVSTRYKIYRVSYVGGNPDWQYVEVKNWGFVPRTAKKLVITNNQPGVGFYYSIGEIVVGLTYDRKLRIFDGSGDQIISNNIEKDNKICDFALEKIPFVGSGTVITFSETDPNQNVYKMICAIGADSQQTTHMLNYDGRSMALFPYSNMTFNCMCMAESANQRRLMAFDRNGYCHMMDSGNLDGNSTPIHDIFESPMLFEKTPSQSCKGYKTDLFFTVTNAGKVYYLDRIDFQDSYKYRRTLIIDGSSPKLMHFESIDAPEGYNVYQFLLSSSGGTNDPWRLQRYDHFTKGLGIGKNN